MIQQILKQKQRFRSYQESGYSILEGLVAMIMVAALMSAVAPIIAYSVGTRVQARKVELAAQAARSYIDAVRLGKLDPPPSLASDQEITQEIPADALITCPQTQGGLLQYCPDPLNKFYCVDNDDDDECTFDSLTDMMVYGAIDLNNIGKKYKEKIDTNSPGKMQELGYILQVKVYRAQAFSNSVTLSDKGVPFTVNNSGLATIDGDKERPLFVTKTEIAPTKDLFQNIKDRTNKE
jgi:type II secretory pathway pseudopilin PulG